MIVNIEDPKLDQELQSLSSDLGQSVNEIVIVAVQEKLNRIRSAKAKKIDWNAVRKIQAEVATMPILDTRTADEIIGYPEFGHFDWWSSTLPSCSQSSLKRTTF